MDCIVRKIKRFSGIDKKSFYNSIHCTHALTIWFNKDYIKCKLNFFELQWKYCMHLHLKIEWLNHLNESFSTLLGWWKNIGGLASLREKSEII